MIVLLLIAIFILAFLYLQERRKRIEAEEDIDAWNDWPDRIK